MLCDFPCRKTVQIWQRLRSGCAVMRLAPCDHHQPQITRNHYPTPVCLQVTTVPRPVGGATVVSAGSAVGRSAQLA